MNLLLGITTVVKQMGQPMLAQAILHYLPRIELKLLL